jgi:hypothetical protein
MSGRQESPVRSAPLRGSAARSRKSGNSLIALSLAQTHLGSPRAASGGICMQGFRADEVGVSPTTIVVMQSALLPDGLPPVL